jgi:hypothetical protein
MPLYDIVPLWMYNFLSVAVSVDVIDCRMSKTCRCLFVYLQAVRSKEMFWDEDNVSGFPDSRHSHCPMCGDARVDSPPSEPIQTELPIQPNLEHTSFDGLTTHTNIFSDGAFVNYI